MSKIIHSGTRIGGAVILAAWAVRRTRPRPVRRSGPHPSRGPL